MPNQTLRLKADPRIRFAGQLAGCEGYVESAAIGLLAGRFAGADAGTFQPMNVNFGLFPPLANQNHKGRRPPRDLRGRQGKLLMSERALKALEEWKMGMA